MIQAAIRGRLGADPIERETQSGKSMVTVSLAVDVGRHGHSEITEWFSLSAFGAQAKSLLRHKKGDLISCFGDLHKTKYMSKDGVEKENWSLTAQSILSARTTRSSGGGGKKKKTGTTRHGLEPGQVEGQGTYNQNAELVFDDPIPF